MALKLTATLQVAMTSALHAQAVHVRIVIHQNNIALYNRYEIALNKKKPDKRWKYKVYDNYYLTEDYVTGAQSSAEADHE